MKEATVSGTVVLRKWAEGSKAEHESYCLETDYGFLHKLRRDLQTNPFELDPWWEQWEGKHVTVSGTLLNNGTLTGTVVTEHGG